MRLPPTPLRVLEATSWIIGFPKSVVGAYLDDLPDDSQTFEFYPVVGETRVGPNLNPIFGAQITNHTYPKLALDEVWVDVVTGIVLLDSKWKGETFGVRFVPRQEKIPTPTPTPSLEEMLVSLLQDAHEEPQLGTHEPSTVALKVSRSKLAEIRALLATRKVK